MEWRLDMTHFFIEVINDNMHHEQTQKTNLGCESEFGNGGVILKV